MTPPGRTAFVVLFCFSCASSGAPQRPSDPEPRPACFTGAGAIDIPLPTAPLERSGVVKEMYGVGGLGPARPPNPLIVIPGQPLYHGAIERDVLRKSVRPHLPELATCPDTKAAPDFGGRIVVDFVIDPQGRVERASIRSSSAEDPKAETCVGQQVCRWTFPASRDGGRVVVSHPFVFTTQVPPGVSGP
jgi:TonB family protein